MRFQVIYDGPALEDNRMDVRDLAPALLAIGEVLEQANYTLNGAAVPISVRVEASFKTGCFGIVFEIGTLWQQIQGLFPPLSMETARQLLEDLGLLQKAGAAVVSVGLGLVGFIRWLKGRKIKRVELLDNGNVRVVVDEEQLVLERRVLELYRNHQLRVALERAIVKPLEREGIVSFATGLPNGETQRFVEISRAESRFFMAPPAEEQQLSSEESERTLQLVSVTFKDDNKWRFTDGATSFHAAIEDIEFQESVLRGRQFAAGDVLKVKLRVDQWMRGDKLQSEYAVVKVLEHRKAGVQLSLPVAPPPSND